MSETPTPLPSTIAATREGLAKVRQRMAELPKPSNPEKKGWTQKELADKSGASIDTVKRFLNRTSIRRDFISWICEALKLDVTEVVNPEEWNPPAPTPTPAPPEINWREKCQEILETRRQLASNLFTTGTDIILNLDDIHVPLGLIEPKQKPQPKNDCFPQQGSEVYGISKEEEKITPISSDEFFSNVLAKGNSPKSQGKRLSIVGEPGSGKTTQLLKIADWVLAETEKLPVWVSLAEVGAKNLDDYLREDWLNRTFGKAKATEIQAEFEQLLSDGKVWLLLDGSDEMGMSDPLGKLAQSLRVAVFKNVPVVLSCRLNFWEAAANALFDFDTYKMLDFSYGEANNLDQVSLFINKWFSAPSMPLENQKLGGELRKALEEPGKERIKDLARNPLRLSLLCLTWGFGNGNLPDTKAELYEVFVEALYELKKGIFTTDSDLRSRLNRALGQLGLTAIDSGYKSILPDWLVNEALAKPHPELFEEAIKLGWLNRVGVDAQNPLKSVYAFYHPTFQEYFAACEIEDGEYLFKPVIGNPQEGCYRIFEKQWKEVFLLWLGRKDVGKEKKEDLIAELWNFEDECDKFYWYRAVFLAAVGITEFKECALADKIVVPIVRWSFTYFKDEKRSWVTYFYPFAEGARQILKETHRQKAIDALVDLLANTEDENTRRRVGECVGEIDPGNQKAIDSLVDLLAKTKDEDIRRDVAKSFGKIAVGNPKAINTLVDLLANSEKQDILRRVVECLGKIAVGNQKAIDALVDLLAKTKYEFTRRDVAESLGKIAVGNQKAIDALVDLLANTENEDIRRDVVKCLGKIAVGNQKAIDTLVDLLPNTDNEFTRRDVADSLGKIAVGNQKAIDALVDLLANTEDEFTRRDVAESLCKIAPGNQKAIDALVDLLPKTKDEYTRRDVAESLGKIAVGNQKTIDALVNLLPNTDNELTRRDVVKCLGKIAVGNQKAIDALVDLLANTEDEFTRRDVAESLCKIAPGNQKAIDALVDLLPNTDNEFTRRDVAESLGKIAVGNQKTIDALVNLLPNTDNELTRRDVVKCLGKIAVGNQKAIDALVDLLLNTDNEFTRRQVAYSLCKIAGGNQKAIDALVDLLPNTQDIDTPWLVAESLGKIDPGNQKAIDALVDLLANTEDKDTPWLVAESLGKIAVGNQKAIDALVDLLANIEDEFTRRDVAESLGKIAPGNQKAIDALVDLLANTQDIDTPWLVAESLSKIAVGNQKAIDALVDLLANTQDEDTRRDLADGLQKILEDKKQFQQVVTQLKNYFSSKTCKSNLDLYINTFELLWHCAQNLTYPEFYTAWHYQPPTHYKI